MMKQEFSTHLTMDEVAEFIKKNTNQMNWGTILSNKHPDWLWFSQKDSRIELYYPQGRRIMPAPVYFCTLSPHLNATRISGHVGYQMGAYVALSSILAVSLLLAWFINDMGGYIMAFVFTLSCGGSLIRVKFGNRKEKLKVETAAVEIIKKIAEPVE